MPFHSNGPVYVKVSRDMRSHNYTTNPMVSLRGIFRTEVIAKNVGKMVSSSKRMIKWGLIINLKKVEIVLKHSTMSGKRMIRVNEAVVHESRKMLASSFSTSFTVDDYLVEISFVKENSDYIYDMFVDGIPYMDLLCVYDLDEEDRLCIEKGEIPKKKRRVAKDVAEEAEESFDFDAPVEKRITKRKHKNYLSSQGFGDMSEDDVRKSCVFTDLDKKLSEMHLNLEVEDAGVDVSDIESDWEKEETRHHLKDLSKKVVVPEKQKKVKVIKPKYKKMDGEMYGQLK